jgi:AraC family transcriptional regulator
MTMENVLIKDIPSRTVACLKCRGSWDQLPVMVETLRRQMADRRLKASGPPSGVYYNGLKETGARDLEWEVFYPVVRRLVSFNTGGWEFGVRKISGYKVASLYHEGPHSTAGSTYRRLEEWILDNGLRISGPAEEVYLTDFTVPESSLLMEIRIPVVLP